MAIALLPARPRTIEDVDALAAAIADGLEVEYVQLEAKRFSARWTVVALRDVVVQFACEDVAVVRRIRVPAGKWAFVVPLAVSESARWNAHVVNADDVIVCAPGAESYACDPGGTRFAIISVAETTPVAASARAFFEAGTTGTLRLRPRDARQLHQRLGAIASGATIASAFDAGVGGMLGLCVGHALAGDGQLDASVCRSQIVRRAEDFFRRHVGEPVSIAQLSSVAGVSERSLRNAFYDVYTTSPKRYLRLWQLHQVRRALRSPDRREATVTDVATFHGFYELGRFAGEYKALFGEMPSQTLQRARSALSLRERGAA
jgi:AraC-like DNA-binding protein